MEESKNRMSSKLEKISERNPRTEVTKSEDYDWRNKYTGLHAPWLIEEYWPMGGHISIEELKTKYAKYFENEK